MTPTFDLPSLVSHLLTFPIGTLGLVVALLLGGLRILIWYTTGECKSKSRMDGKVVIITGGDSGIGKETVTDLAKRGAKVIMASLNVENAEMVREELVRSTGNSKILVRKLDLSSLSSVRKFAEQINREETRLDVLIHNAGTAEAYKKKVSVDGLELTMAINYYGPFLLTHLLIDLLKKSAPSRIIVVASVAYLFSYTDPMKNPNPTSTFAGLLYFVSKYADVQFTLELARRLQGSGVTANCLHPGVIWTSIWGCVPPPFSWILGLVLKSFFKTPKQGAQTSIHLAVSDEVADISGKYFMDCQEHSLMPGVKSEATGKKLWELSEDLVKLGPTDPKI